MGGEATGQGGEDDLQKSRASANGVKPGARQGPETLDLRRAEREG